jgi:hypothetical protein
MLKRYFVHWLAILLVAAPVGSAVAQQAATDPTLTVFLDCHTFYCDFDHFRREIMFVNWARDRQDADVHILITQQQTGGGGWEMTLAFIGSNQFTGREDTLLYIADRDDTQDEIRSGLTNAIKIGLVPFVAGTPAAEHLVVLYQPPTAAAPVASTQQEDPWDFWVFELRARGSVNGESQQRFYSGSSSVEASRTTEDLKLSFEASWHGNRQEFDLIDTLVGLDTTIVSTRNSYELEGLSVWSLDPHWSLGVSGSARRSTVVNQDLTLRGGPAIEYNIFPYDESTRRQLTFRYSLGLAAFNYDEVTIYDKTSEVLPTHNLRVGLSVTQPWGRVFTSFNASQFLNDLTKHQLSLFGSVSFRVFRGLNFDVFGSVARIKDQLFISSVGLTQEEILLRQAQRETDFRYDLSIGFSYRFGSRFNNVVNPRMGGGGGGMIMMIM